MNDYTWPSVYFAYFFFAISLGVGVYFFVRSFKDGYWGKHGEDIKYSVFDDAGTGRADKQAGRPAPQRSIAATTSELAPAKSQGTPARTPAWQAGGPLYGNRRGARRDADPAIHKD
jgi:hypothetical protein